MTEPTRSRRWIVWLAIFVMFLLVWAGGLLWHAPLSQWVVSPKDVEAELARRAAAGDTVRAEELAWTPAQAGRPWREVVGDFDGGLDLLRDPDALRERIVPLSRGLLNGYITSTSAFEELREIAESPLWELDEAELAARWRELDRAERDPARIADEPLRDRSDRMVRSLAIADPPEDLCELGTPAGLDAFRATIAEGFEPDVEDPDAPLDPLVAWSLVEAARLSVVDAARTGGVERALRIADGVRCVERSLGEPVTMMHGLLRLRARGRFARGVEAALPWLEWDQRRELVARVAAVPEIEPAAYCARSLRVERAHVHAVYARAFAEHGGDGLGVVGALFPGRPMHGVFLDALEDFDDALEAYERGGGYAATRARLVALEQRREVGDLERTLSPAVIVSPGPLEAATRAEALRRMWLVALALLDGGTEVAAERAASLADPFGAGVLHTRRRDDGVFEIWSVGSNGVDDGGATATEPGADDLDLVLRVPQFEALRRDED